MRGIKKKRDLVTLAESIDHGSVASEEVEGIPETTGIGLSYSHTVTVGASSSRVSPSQSGPANRHVTGMTHQWLGLSSTTPAQLDRLEGEANRLQANQPKPYSCQLSDKPNYEGEEGLINLPTGGTGNAHMSGAAGASGWLEARTNPAGRSTRASQGESSEGRDLEPPPAGVTIEERHLTQEDFWSLLRDAGYETW